MISITGTLIWYYYICKRETWLMAHQITPNQHNELIELGKILSDVSYKKDKREIRVGNVVFDLVKSEESIIIIGEVKKSSKFEEGAKMQLAFYLKNLKNFNISARGELLFPKEKKKVIVELNNELFLKLKDAELNIRNIILSEELPSLVKIKYCKKCAYNEFCWS